MRLDSSNTTLMNTVEPLGTSIQSWIKFGVFLALEPFSLILNVLLLYYLVTDKQLRQALHHHVIFLLLLVGLCSNLIEVPRVLHYLRLGYVAPKTVASCLVWQWIDYLLFAETNWFMMWAAFERHILVFHSHLLNTRNGRLFNHYLPLTFITVYLNLFYTVVIFFHPCAKMFDYNAILCGQACYTTDKALSLFDLFFHSWLAIFLITICSIALIIRVFYSKRIQTQHRSQWRRYRRMIVQLLSVSLIYLACMGPYSALEIVDIVIGLPPIANYVKLNYFFYIYWLVTLLIPFICIGCLPEVTNKFQRQLFKWLKIKNSVAPVPTTIH